MHYKSVILAALSALTLASAIPTTNGARDVQISQIGGGGPGGNGGNGGNGRGNNGKGNDRKDDENDKDDNDDNDNNDDNNLVIALFNGMNTNIIIQQNEQSTVLALINFMSSGDKDNKDVFEDLKNNLVIIVDSDVNVRENNERLADKVGINDEARNGFKNIKDSQDQIIILINSMTGEADNDLPILNQMLDAFSNNYKQSQANQQIILLA
ncbi:hypothetical protein UCRNP2_8135 [Neofusicoccum parvum UCRNP2]|uniref:Uncharacterized protein n=1 Tax=Botryosphaeria parva (strain UCR-NP2) TaxID=1287680 RepID=R1G165_BOTPV|nr:hypothetical protein UCRNP2_8135 [Neofusicoccum parvum UCRNP2]